MSAVWIGAGVVHATIGGLVFESLRLPLPWLIGPLLTVGLANLSGLRLQAPNGGRQAGQVVIGASIGLYFTPEVAGIVLTHLPSMAAVALLSILFAIMGSWILARIARMDPITAYFGTVPGGMAEMLALGDRLGAQPLPMTLAQVIRVTIIVLTLPPALTWTGMIGADPFSGQRLPVDWTMLGLVLAACGGAAIALNRLNMANAWMLGACVVAAALTVGEIETTSMPGFLSRAAQGLIGLGLGARFNREEFAKSPRVVVGAACATVFLMVLCLGLAGALWLYSGLPLATLIAATAPGGLAEMSITAQVLNLGVPVVTAFHIMRIFMITLATMPMFRALDYLRRRTQGR